MKVFEKLRLKLNKELGLDIPEDAVFKRTHAGHWQLSAGAWKWVCYWKSNPHDLGSGFTATEILNAKKISYVEARGGYMPEIWVDD